MTTRTYMLQARSVIAAVTLACALIMGTPWAPIAVSSAAPNVASAQATLDRAVARQTTAQRKVDAIKKRAAEQSARLDQLASKRAQLLGRLEAYSAYLYRNGRLDTFALLMQSQDFNDFTSRWTMLARVTSENARLLVELAETNRAASASAKRLIKEQEAAAAALDELEMAETRARGDLANSKAVYAEYKRRTTVKKTAASSPTPTKAKKYRPTGDGAWSTGVASHYGKNFSGRAADGSRIGPHTMMVAHKTLPFGTLVEFEYNGKTAVGRVADRGPFVAGRDWDLGPGLVRVLDFNGVHKVRYRVVGR